MIHKIEITEILQAIIEVEAKNKKTALKLVEQSYNKCGIILDSSNFISVKINVFEEE